MFSRLGLTLSDSSINNWMNAAGYFLTALYDKHKELVLNANYLHADETTIRVMDTDKKGTTHQGYHWVYQSHVDKLVLFEYQKGRGREGPREMLKYFKGYLQTDGYQVYEEFGKQEGIVINFYRVCKNRFHDLSSLVRVTLHSREDHDNAWIIYNKPQLFDEVRRAWAVWVLSTQSFSSMLDGSWGYDKTDDTTTRKISNKREEFTEQLAIRLQHAQIECADALYVIQSRDQVDSFFYCDPPYYNSNCGHYDGYTEEDFEALLKTLAGIKGKFMLSSYPGELLKRYTKANNWQMWSVEQGVTVNLKGGYLKRKVEVITANFELRAG